MHNDSTQSKDRKQVFYTLCFLATFFGGWFTGHALEVSFMWLAVVLIGLSQMVISAIWRQMRGK